MVGVILMPLRAEYFRIMSKDLKARVIAMYLPQYHPIPENDATWGTGFTEWTNVVQAKPLFKGHYQPHLPADLGFYDLRLPEVREAQAKMAQEAGIEGFMYWHYWFGNGKQLLERPFQEVLQSGKPDFPFCLGWANHSWSTKTWIKGKSLSRDTMIVEQLYPGKEDYIKHFKYVLPAFKDERYIKVDGKPIFVIFDPLVIPDIKQFIELWRQLAIENELLGIHFVGLRNGRRSSMQSLLDMGFDAINNRSMWEAEAAVIGSKIRRRLISLFSWKMGVALSRYEYKDVMKNLCTDDDYLENVYPTILPGYDRTARAGRRAIIYHNATPEHFGNHVSEVLRYVEDKPDERKIIFLKSWNEWGEGNHMEPDLKYGRGFLNELKKRIFGAIVKDSK